VSRGGVVEQFKQLVKAKPKTLALLIFLTVNFAILHMFSVWQLDLICAGPVWNYGWKPPEPRYADQPFQCWIWKTTIGEAYDTLFFLNFISYWGTLITLIYLLYVILKYKQ